MKTIGIYCIRHVQTGTSYIGKSIEIENRFTQHRNGHSRCPSLQDAINKHGINQFAFEIVETCPENQLDNRERFWIATLDTYHNGYNQTTGGGSGSRLSDETRAKMSQSRIGKTPTEETRKKLRIARRNRSISEEQKEKLRGEKNGMYGKTLTVEHRQAISQANKGKPKSAEQRKKMSEAQRGEKNHNYGKKASPETRAKMREAHKQRWAKRKSEPQQLKLDFD